MEDDTNLNVKSQFVTDTSSDLVDQENGKNNDVRPGNAEKQDDVVKHSTYQKLLNQHKGQKSELEELREFKLKMEEKEQLKKGEYEKLLGSRDERIKELQETVNSFEQKQIEEKKISEFSKMLPGKIKHDHFYAFVDMDAIQMNPETGGIDKITLEKEVDRYVKTYPDAYHPSNQKGLPNVGYLGGKANLKRSLKELSREELRQQYLKGNFKE